ncbi:hypothetical protein QKW35_21110, partial [Pontibacterium granulatum]|uniref:hypothetical protein n=1 Tax=Pontibacterium granulatum TaxID=2036029 RepID=UPI002499CF10
QLKDYAMGAFPLCHAEVATQVHDKDHNDITFATNIPVLTEVHDKAFVTGSGINNPPDPTGDVSFQLYSGLDCMPGNESGSPEVVALGSGNPAMAESTPFMPAAGEWSFSASYEGDNNYPSASLPGEDCEPFTIIKRNATVATNIHDADHNDITGGDAFIGDTIHDKAFVTGDGVAPTPTGTVTFYRYATGNCSGTPTTETISLSGGSAESSGFQLPAAGGLSYLATYSGDQYYNEIKLGDLSTAPVPEGDCEPLTVNKVDADIATHVHDANHGDITGSSVDVGSIVHDKAVVTGLQGTPTGTVTFYRYATGNCSGTATTETVSLSGGMAESSDYATVLSGALSYVAIYSGDAIYNPIALGDLDPSKPVPEGDCEPLTINKIDADIATHVHDKDHSDITNGSIDVGFTVHDKADVTGALSTPTGTVTFYRYATANCTGTATSETVSLSGGMAESAHFTTVVSGALSYVAIYSGDGVYNPITLGDLDPSKPVPEGDCEPLTVNKIDADIATHVHDNSHADITGGSVPVGSTVHDKADVTGALNAPTGTVTFYRYATGNCTGAASTETVALSGGMAESGSFTPMLSGALSYVAIYSGDDVYNPITLGDLDPSKPVPEGDCEPLTVNKINANVVTHVHDDKHADITGSSVDVGAVVHDKSDVTGGLTVPTGSVTFYRYATGNCSGTATTETVELSGGMAESSDFSTVVSGALSYLATYSGDGVYYPISLGDLDPSKPVPEGDCEPLTVNKVDADIATHVHDTNHGDITGSSVDVGSTVHDKANVTGLQGTPTGTVTFYRYATGNCTGAATTQTVSLSGGMAESNDFTTVLSGALSYVATYSGDNVYNPITLGDLDPTKPVPEGDCEPLTVNKIDANVVTHVHDANHGDITGGSVDVGSTVHDKADVSGGLGAPTGSVTFYRYPTANCTGTPTLQTVALAGGMAESAAYTTLVSGGLSYVATYSGDSVYNPISLGDLDPSKPVPEGDCEPLTVNKIDANVVTHVHDANHSDITGGSVDVGATVHDKADVTGGLGTPTGSVTFYRYPTGNCSGTPTTETVGLSGGMAESSDFLTTLSGGLSYVATYSGDSVYNPIGLGDLDSTQPVPEGDCEPLTVNKIDANVATNIHVGDRVGPGHDDVDVQGGQIDVGNSIHDKVTVSGILDTPTGDVTFYRYATLDCSGEAMVDGPWALGGDGTQESSTFTPGIGDLSYLATYSGDGVYNPITLGDLAGNLPAHCEPLTVVGVFEACTPGYWKQPQHFGNWAAPYSAVPVETKYVDVFGIAGNLPGLPGKYKDITLLEALEAEGNTDKEALLRHSAAALLNAANADVNYPLSVDEVITLVRAAFANDTAAA